MSSIAESLSLAVKNHQSGNLQEAEVLYRQVLAQNPQNANALNLLGVLFAQTERFDESVTSLRAAIAVHDDQPQFHFNLGNALRKLGQNGEAEVSYRRCVELDATHVQAHFELASIARLDGRREDAIAGFERVIELNPNHLDANNNLGMLLIEAGFPRRGLRALNHAVATRPDFGRGHANLGKACLDLGNPIEAERHLRRALVLLPDDPVVLNSLGNALSLQSKAAEAVEMYRAALNHDPEYAHAHVNLGNALRAMQRHDEAVASYDRSLEMTTDDGVRALAHYGRAFLYERLSEIEQATEDIERAHSLDPKHRGVQLLRARIARREGRLEEGLAIVESIREDPSMQRMRGSASVEAGRILDKMGRYDEAFEMFATGQEALSESPIASRHDWTSYLNTISNSRNWIDASGPANWETSWDDGVSAPTFFVGFPRSGTTLTEQILDSHPGIVATDEAPLLPMLVEHVPQMLVDRPKFPAGLQDLTPDQVRTLRSMYWENASRFVGQADLEGRHLVDKLPLNLVNLPLVRRIFPEAKVITALRDPRDVCLSCLMQEFRPNVAMVHFYTLETTARLYVGVMDLWMRYREHIGLASIETRYEDLVNDLEGSARRLLEFLGMPWDDAVLAYTDRAKERLISTPSYEAVSRPIYKSSAGRWRNYEAQLEPVREMLQPFIEAFGYEA